MPLWVKEFATSHDNLNVIPGPHVVKRDTPFPELSFDLHMYTGHVPSPK